MEDSVYVVLVTSDKNDCATILYCCLTEDEKG